MRFRPRSIQERTSAFARAVLSGEAPRPLRVGGLRFDGAHAPGYAGERKLSRFGWLRRPASFARAPRLRLGRSPFVGPTSPRRRACCAPTGASRCRSLGAVTCRPGRPPRMPPDRRIDPGAPPRVHRSTLLAIFFFGAFLPGKLACVSIPEKERLPGAAFQLIVATHRGEHEPTPNGATEK